MEWISFNINDNEFPFIGVLLDSSCDSFLNMFLQFIDLRFDNRG